jgi:hypothetical protein
MLRVQFFLITIQVIPKKVFKNQSFKLKLVIPAPAYAGINYGRNLFLRTVDSR